MAHVMKATRGGCGGLTKHYERAKNPKGEFYKFRNTEIDTARSHLNYNLGPAREESQLKFINRRCEELGALKRADVNVMASWIVTLPKDMPGGEGLRQKFFEQVYEFLETRYGKHDNVISAHVHMDETTPHIHFAFVPVLFDEKKKKLKVSAKEVLTKKDLQTFHQDLVDFMCEKKGWSGDFGILNGQTKPVKNVAELKELLNIHEKNLSTVKKEIEERQEELENLTKSISETYSHEQKNKFKNAKNALEEITKTKPWDAIALPDTQNKAQKGVIFAFEKVLGERIPKNAKIVSGGDFEAFKGKLNFLGNHLDSLPLDKMIEKADELERVEALYQRERRRLERTDKAQLEDSLNKKTKRLIELDEIKEDYARQNKIFTKVIENMAYDAYRAEVLDFFDGHKMEITKEECRAICTEFAVKKHQPDIFHDVQVGGIKKNGEVKATVKWTDADGKRNSAPICKLLIESEKEHAKNQAAWRATQRDKDDDCGFGG